MWLIPPREYVEYMRKQARIREEIMINDIETAPFDLHYNPVYDELAKLEDKDA